MVPTSPVRISESFELWSTATRSNSFNCRVSATSIVHVRVNELRNIAGDQAGRLFVDSRDPH